MPRGTPWGEELQHMQPAISDAFIAIQSALLKPVVDAAAGVVEICSIGSGDLPAVTAGIE
jgi:hypothetical protein